MIATAATPIAITWTACTIIGLAANAWGFLDAYADRRWLIDSGLNGRRMIVASWHVTLNAALFYVQCAFLAGGIVAVEWPSQSTGGARIARMFVQLMFLTAEPVLVALAIEARRYRGRLLASRSMKSIEKFGAEADLEE